tara:strand:+ start:41 stop:409 length:369 start_codon:yes stop_codon:yes gene_type:complete
MDFLGKALRNVANLGAKGLRTGQALGQKAVNTAKRGIDVVEGVPIVGDAIQLVPGYGTAKKAVDLAQRGVNVAGRGADLLESRTPSEAVSRAMGLGREAMGVRQRFKTTGGGTKFLKGELER